MKIKMIMIHDKKCNDETMSKYQMIIIGKKCNDETMLDHHYWQ